MLTLLEDGRKYWAAVIHDKGGYCPCRDRWGKIYPRQFNATMARSLIWLAAWEKDDGWCDVPNTAPKSVVRTNQLPTTRWWGLAERQPSGDRAAKHSGWWRATDKGNRFARGLITVPKEVYTYNAEVLYFGADEIHIKDTFKTVFDYEQVMLPATMPRGQQEWAF